VARSLAMNASNPATKLANLDGRAVLLRDGRCIDVEHRSGGKLSSDPMALIADMGALCDWATDVAATDDDAALDEAKLGPCVPMPSQVFAIGLNYRDHAQEASIPIPAKPMVFTKFPSCLAGPRAEVKMKGDTTDYEVELVVVIGRGGVDIAEGDAMAHVAGYCIGQDITDRRMQFSDKPPQFSMGKSLPGFGPIGPAVVALRDIASPQDLAITCDVNGERRQDSRTSKMIFSVPQLVADLSSRCALRSGDLVFTGTTSGVGSLRNPRSYLKAGDEVVSEIEGLGTMVNRVVS